MKRFFDIIMAEGEFTPMQRVTGIMVAALIVLFAIIAGI